MFDICTNPKTQASFKFKPRDYQEDFFNNIDKKKRVCLLWSRRHGKDKCMFIALVYKALKRKGNYVYLFPTASLARKALWNHKDSNSGFEMLDHIPEGCLKHVNQIRMELTLSNGSLINVYGLDKNPDAARGSAVHGVIASEYAFQIPSGLTTLIPSLVETNGFLWVNSTANGTNHFFEVVEEAKKNPDKWFFDERQTWYQDKDTYTGIMAKEEIEKDSALLTTTQEDSLTFIEREYGNNFNTAIEGSFYGECIREAEKKDRIGFYPKRDNEPVYAFWDLGATDPNAIWLAQMRDTTLIFIGYEEIESPNFMLIVQRLIKKNYNVDTHFLPWDGNSKKMSSTDEFTYQDMLCNAYKALGQDTVVEITPKYPPELGIRNAQNIFHEFYFDANGCDEGLAKLRNYSKKYNRELQLYISTPKHDEQSHCADAFRVAVQQYKANNIFSRQYSAAKRNIKKLNIIRDSNDLF